MFVVRDGKHEPVQLFPPPRTHHQLLLQPHVLLSLGESLLHQTLLVDALYMQLGAVGAVHLALLMIALAVRGGGGGVSSRGHDFGGPLDDNLLPYHQQTDLRLLSLETGGEGEV